MRSMKAQTERAWHSIAPEDLSDLPARACVSLAARSASRVLDVIERERRQGAYCVQDVVALASEFAGSMDSFDSEKVSALASATGGARIFVEDTGDAAEDLGWRDMADGGVIGARKELALLNARMSTGSAAHNAGLAALRVAKGPQRDPAFQDDSEERRKSFDLSSEMHKIRILAANAASAAIRARESAGGEPIVGSIESDIRHLRAVSQRENWQDDTPVPQSIFAFCSCFLSSCASDQELAHRLYADLKKEGISVWKWDYDEPLGSAIEPTITQMIRSSDRVVVLLGQKALLSSWVRFEVKEALQLEIESTGQQDHVSRCTQSVLLPLRVDNIGIEEIEAWIGKRHIGDVRAWEEQEAVYRKVVERLIQDLRRS